MTKKQLILIASISLGLLLAFLVVSASRKPTNQKAQDILIVPQNSPLAVSSKKEQKKSINEKQELDPHLPIYIEDIPTSSGKLTTLNIFSSEYDPEYTVRLEIYGINYNNSEPSISNPDYTAFQETFYRAQEELRSRNIEPDEIVFIYGNREYINQVASGWVNILSGK